MNEANSVVRLNLSCNPDQIDEWIDSLVACNVCKEKFKADNVKNANTLFKEISINDHKIKCFWDRFTGITFVKWRGKIQTH